MVKKSLSYFIFTAVLFLGLWFGVQASNPFDITFPVKELGNCQNENTCKTYCDKPANVEACLNFAEAHGLVAKEEATRMRKFHEKGITAGPGGCRTKDECETYCDNITNIEECLAFAENEGILPPDELKEARQVAQALRAGAALPGGCTSKEECEEYCEDPSNVMECVDFAEKAGFMSPEEAAMVRKTGGVGPGGCKGKEACEKFCENPNNFETCVTFAHENGMMSDEEFEDAQHVARAVKEGAKIPGGCRSKECAEEYCADPTNFEECITFAEMAGFLDSEEAERMRKIGSMAGPGGCRGDFECRTYCDDPSHAEECVEFAVKAGMMDPEEAEEALKMMRLGITSGPGDCRGRDECEEYCEDPDNGEECMQFALEHGLMDPKEAEMARKMMAGGGPGGCKREEECREYCDDPDHGEECLNFAIENGLMDPEELEQARKMMRGGPGGCKGQIECEAYCQNPSHAEECIRFAVEMGQMSEEEAENILEMMRGGPGGNGEFNEEFEELMPDNFQQEIQQEEIEQFKEDKFDQEFEAIREKTMESLPRSTQLSPEQLQQLQEQLQQLEQFKKLEQLQRSLPPPSPEPQQQQPLPVLPSQDAGAIGKTLYFLLKLIPGL